MNAPISDRERALIALVPLVCNQELGAPFARALRDAEGAGVSREDVKEALLHLVIYASFPKVLCALRVLALTPLEAPRVRDEAIAAPPPRNLFCQPEVRAALEAIDPSFADLAMRMAGEVWGRGGLSQRERAFLCIVAHVANRTPEIIPVHARIALETGATRQALRHVLGVATCMAGARTAREASNILDGFLLSHEGLSRSTGRDLRVA